MILPPLLDKTEYSLTEQVFHTLRQAILTLQLKPREHLIIGDVADHYSISRTPVREALIMLEQEGWVISDGRRGAQVTAPSEADLLEVIELQAILEAHVAKRAATLLTDQDIKALDALLKKSDQLLKRGDEDGRRMLSKEFHRRLADSVGNSRLTEQIRSYEEYIERVWPLVWRSGDAPPEESSRQHWQIYQALKSRNAVEAEQLMFHHTVWYEKELSAAVKYL